MKFRNERNNKERQKSDVSVSRLRGSAIRHDNGHGHELFHSCTWRCALALTAFLFFNCCVFEKNGPRGPSVRCAVSRQAVPGEMSCRAPW